MSDNPPSVEEMMAKIRDTVQEALLRRMVLDLNNDEHLLRIAQDGLPEQWRQYVTGAALGADGKLNIMLSMPSMIEIVINKTPPQSPEGCPVCGGVVDGVRTQNHFVPYAKDPAERLLAMMGGPVMNVGQLLISRTRTYSPCGHSEEVYH